MLVFLLPTKMQLIFRFQLLVLEIILDYTAEQEAHLMALLYPTNFQLQTAASYLHTHTQWADHRGKADSNGAYLDAALHYQKNNFSTSLTLLSAYSYISTIHTLQIGYPIKAQVTPHTWDLAEKLHLQYAYTYKSISYIPKLEAHSN